MIVGGAHGVLFAVGKLAFYPVAVIALFIEQGRGHRAEAVDRHFSSGVSHAAQGVQQANIRNRPGRRGQTGEYKLPVTRELPHGREQLHHLPGKRHDMGALHLHAFGGYKPFRFLKVYLVPCRAAQLA